MGAFFKLENFVSCAHTFQNTGELCESDWCVLHQIFPLNKLTSFHILSFVLTVKSTSESCTHKDFPISIFTASVDVATVTCEERCHEQDFLFVLLTHLKKEEVANTVIHSHHF